MYLKTKRNVNLITVFLLTTFFVSCDISYLDKEIEDFTWDGNAKVPVGFINYNVSEIFTDLGSDDFTTSSIEEFSFIYTESFIGEGNEAFSVAIDDVTIEDSVDNPITSEDLANLNLTFPYTITSEISPGVQNPLIGTFSESNQTIYDLELSQELTGASLNGGNMIITFNSNTDASTNVSIEIPSFTKKSDDSIFRTDIMISGESQETISINLDEYNADFTNNGSEIGLTTNTIMINLDASFTFAEGNVIEENDSAILYSVVLSSVDYEVIHGDFKEESFNVSSNTIDLGDFFDNFNDADIEFENVKMSINITNDYGFPIGIDLSSVRGVGGASSTNLTYTGDQSILNTIIVDPVEDFGDSPKLTSRVLDDTNSNIATLLKEKPTSLEFAISGSANPLSNGSTNSNFYAADNMGLQAEINISFDQVSLTKKIDFDGSSLEDLSYATLSVAVENKIPLGGTITLNFKSSSEQIVHTETFEAFKAASINSSGESDGIPVVSDFNIELSESEINTIIEVETIDLKVDLILPDGEDTVILKGTDELNVNVGLEASANITSDNN